MSNRRKKPPAPGVYCNATMSSGGGSQCHDPAVFLVMYAVKETGEQKRENACGAHLGRLVQQRTAMAEFSREMFRVVPWETAMAESAKHG